MCLSNSGLVGIDVSVKKDGISRCRAVLRLAAVVLFLGCTNFGYVSTAADSSKDESQTLETQETLESEIPSADSEASKTDKALFEELLEFQRLIEKNDESDKQYSDEKRCVDTRRIRHYDVLSPRFVAFEMRQSDEFYLVQFEQKCPGLQKNGTLTFEIRSGQSGRLCINDSIKPLEGDFTTQTDVRGGNCRIPSIEKIAEVQLVQLERGIASNRVK